VSVDHTFRRYPGGDANARLYVLMIPGETVALDQDESHGVIDDVEFGRARAIEIGETA
jgi:hypothetical protein